MTMQVPALATETYRRGLSVLVDALELTTTASTPGPDRLRAEMQSLEREIEDLKKNEWLRAAPGYSGTGFGVTS